jgi:NADH-quinone oxidoreductase subunit G
VISRLTASLPAFPGLASSLSEIKDLDAALVVGSFLRKDHPLFAQRLRQLSKKWGKVSLLSVTADDPLISLHARRACRPRRVAAWRWLLSSRRRHNSAASRFLPVWRTSSLARQPGDRQKPARWRKRAIFLGNAPSRVRRRRNCMPGAGVRAADRVPVLRLHWRGANSVGGYVAKALPTALNAYDVRPAAQGLPPARCRTGTRLPQSAAGRAALKAAEAGRHADTRSRTVRRATTPTFCCRPHPFTETSGSFVNCEGRVQSFTACCPPLWRRASRLEGAACAGQSA